MEEHADCPFMDGKRRMTTWYDMEDYLLSDTCCESLKTYKKEFCLITPLLNV